MTHITYEIVEQMEVGLTAFTESSRKLFQATMPHAELPSTPLRNTHPRKYDRHFIRGRGQPLAR